jgi:hypothetical protein
VIAKNGSLLTGDMGSNVNCARDSNTFQVLTAETSP